jgi:hypothetical protein
MSEDRQAQDEELVVAAARAVIAAFGVKMREDLPVSAVTALRLLETALALYEDGKRAIR